MRYRGIFNRVEIVAPELEPIALGLAAALAYRSASIWITRTGTLSG